MSFLLDTDICSAQLRGDRKVFSKFLQYSGRLHVSATTAGESYSWVLRSKAPPGRLQLMQRFLVEVTFLPTGQHAAHRFGVLRADLLDRGQARESTDSFIAATALVQGLILATHSVRHFQGLPTG